MGLREMNARYRVAKEEMNAKKRELRPKDEKALDKRGLDIANYTPEQVKRLNADAIRKINDDMSGSGLLKASLALGGSVTERATLGYLSALVEQNWILIRQNELILKAFNVSENSN